MADKKQQPLIKKQKGGRIRKQKQKEILNKLTELIELGEIHGVTTSQLSKEFGITRKTVTNYVDLIYSTIEPSSVDRIYLEFDKLFDKMFREAKRLLVQSGSGKDKRETLKLILELIRERTKLLENFFRKSKAVDNVAVHETKVEKVVIEILGAK
jgi:hypothetical protein